MAKTNIKREETITRCEDYMLRGYDRPSELSQLLGIAYNTAHEYIGIVKARWQIQGDPTTRELARAELIRKAEEVVKEGWVLKANAKNTMEKVSAMRVVLHAIERLTKLRGLDVGHEDTPVIMSFEFQRHREIEAMAHQVNQLPPEQKQKTLNMVRAEIKRRKADREKEGTAKTAEIL